MNTMVGVGLLLIKHGVFTVYFVGLVGPRSIVCISIVHIINISVHSVYALNYNCECFILFTTLKTCFRRKVLLCLLQVHIFTCTSNILF